MKVLPFQILMIAILFTTSIACSEAVQRSNQKDIQTELRPHGGGMQMPLTGDEEYVVNEFDNGGRKGDVDDFDVRKKDNQFSKPKNKVEYDSSKILLS
ncbi:MAG: hypothetical protein ACI9CF_000115 [Candidatus Omnitrophota bacterium]|jgi:hypothetical protein